MNPVRLYAPDTYREPTLFTHIELMFPFWGVTAKETMPYVRAANLKYQYSTKDFVRAERIEDADYVVVPYQYDRLKAANPQRLGMIVEDAARAGKPLLIDGAGDIEHPIAIPNSVILRVSQYRYRTQPNEIPVPFPAEDLLETYYPAGLTPREKLDEPRVGFTGWARMSLGSRIRTELKEAPTTLAGMVSARRGAERKGLFFRARALDALSRTKGVVNNFTPRATYSGHVSTITGSIDENRREFVETLANSDYALVVKGDANASVRFYEALSMGCIPLFLDTACVLPLEDVINYRDFCVFVDWTNTDRIGEELLAFHHSCTPLRFRQMQLMARDAYRNHLRMDAFSSHLAGLLRERATEHGPAVL
jgi:hypothetical protein